jgi:hypothetical protein
MKTSDKPMSIQNFIRDWGYTGVSDYLQSTFHISSIKPLFLVSVTFGTLATTFKDIIGMDMVLYAAFCVLLTLEFTTGIKASIREGNKVSSKKFGRFIFKVATYTVMLGLTNILATRIEESYMTYIYSGLYWTTFHLITLQLFISVFENMSRLGFQESSKVFKHANKVLRKYLDLKE